MTLEPRPLTFTLRAHSALGSPPPRGSSKALYLSQLHLMPRCFLSHHLQASWQRGQGEDVSREEVGWANPRGKTLDCNPSPASVSPERLQAAVAAATATAAAVNQLTPANCRDFPGNCRKNEGEGNSPHFPTSLA